MFEIKIIADVKVNTQEEAEKIVKEYVDPIVKDTRAIKITSRIRETTGEAVYKERKEEAADIWDVLKNDLNVEIEPDPGFKSWK